MLLLYIFYMFTYYNRFEIIYLCEQYKKRMRTQIKLNNIEKFVYPKELNIIIAYAT